MIRLFIFLACVVGSREIPRRVEVKIVIPAIGIIEPIGSDEEDWQTA
jgi:hypothetical protein